MNLALKPMTADQYLAWLEDQPTWRYELVDGQIVAMNPQRLIHINVKVAVANALKAALMGRKVAHVVGDGMCVRVSNTKVYEPDALVYCGPEKDGNTIVISDPVVVVEILSPGTKTVDTTKKLEGYFKLASVRHYLIVDPAARAVVHHARDAEGAIATAIVSAGELNLSAIGARVPVSSFFPA
jgi:Uma2 family endonuclease